MSNSVIIPKIILAALAECLEAGLVPSIRSGAGGNSHSIWVVSFSILSGAKLHEFEVRIVSSYASFLEFSAHSGFFENDFFPRNAIAPIILMAKKQIDQQAF